MEIASKSKSIILILWAVYNGRERENRTPDRRSLTEQRHHRPLSPSPFRSSITFLQPGSHRQTIKLIHFCRSRHHRSGYPSPPTSASPLFRLPSSSTSSLFAQTTPPSAKSLPLYLGATIEDLLLRSAASRPTFATSVPPSRLPQSHRASIWFPIVLPRSSLGPAPSRCSVLTPLV
ncbi:hypothetical protein PIB30_023417 [Stylosanthes scabra]|uniref:Uncharacterized protein n=1 Tax=Stylosanthes scabra TaxID=79078 RepID=A0ABU6X7U2_9FABA|nr:hypothetical protein [Stylosanthes scabra]